MTLFLALTVNDVDPTSDPDDVADELATIINGGRTTARSRVIVCAIPAPQWLTPSTLANLRAAATAHDDLDGHHPLAIDLVEFVDGQPAEHRAIVAHLAACVPCRRALVNIVQSAKDYPDLFGATT